MTNDAWRVAIENDDVLRRLPLVDLVSRIVGNGDDDALAEFHERRTVFTFVGRERLRFVEYVDCLRALEERRSETVITDEAYDLTIAKFSRLPPAAGPARGGTDCRNYFRPFVERCRDRPPCASALQEEYVAAQQLQGLVSRQFRLSVLESLRRERPGMSRYEWKLPTGTIPVSMPRSILGRHRRQWLEANIPNADPSSPGESRRVQDVINLRLGKQFQTLEDNADYGDHTHGTGRSAPCAGAIPLAESLIEELASEKVERIAELSRGIRAMGESALREMIHDICDNLMKEERGDKAIARPPWMSKVEFSRFAGTRWAARKSVPVLWANLAHLLVSREEFIEVARSRSVWPSVRSIVARSPREEA